VQVIVSAYPCPKEVMDMHSRENSQFPSKLHWLLNGADFSVSGVMVVVSRGGGLR
jgi:hypothetical protein